jgi:hypothetical protein
VLQIHQRVEDRLQRCAGELHIEVVGESLQIHVGRVHLGVEVAPRRIAHVACRHRYRLHAAFVARVGDIHRVFGEDHRVVVSEGYALAAALRGSARDLGRRCLVHQAVHVFGFRDVPVLAELARQVAAGGAE